MMNLKHFLLVLCLFCSTLLSAQVSPSLRAEVYEALASENIKSIENKINKLSSHNEPDSRSFKGALLMKKSGIIQKKKEKLQAFKAGRDLLESVISKYPQNPEYRFLRLMIQEHAPPILKYRLNISQDAQIVRESYHQMPNESQKALKAYVNQSQILTTKDF